MSQETPAPPEIPLSALGPILVVDDEPHLLDLLLDVLSEEGYQPEGAENGRRALEMMKTKRYEAALVDYQLGDTTGLELSREFRRIDPDLNVILMTAHASLDMAIKAIQQEVYDYLIKPVDHLHLFRSLSKALEKRRLSLQIKQLVADLQVSNTQLNHLNELKSRFLSIVTHDLRTPLTSIKGYAQLLVLQKDLTAEQKESFLKIIVKEANHLDGLISDLMDFVSIEAGKLRVELKPGALGEILEDLRSRMVSLAENRKIRFTVEFQADSLPNLNIDKHRLNQVLTNLVGNAFKHTPEGGTVIVKAIKKDAQVRVEVVDSGEGIPPADLPRIFEQFYQVETHASKRDGIGLGLNIAMEIVKAHGGEIGVLSEGQGKGATFWLALPIPA